MDDTWQRADRIFDAALDRPAVERAAFLDEACGGDGALRVLVERLLAEAETLDAFMTPAGALEGAVARSLTLAMDDGDTPAAGTSVGRYRLRPRAGPRRHGRSSTSPSARTAASSSRSRSSW